MYFLLESHDVLGVPRVNEPELPVGTSSVEDLTSHLRVAGPPDLVTTGVIVVGDEVDIPLALLDSRGLCPLVAAVADVVTVLGSVNGPVAVES